MTDAVSESELPRGPWPIPLRRAIDAIATVFMQAYMLARCRALGSRAGAIRAIAQRDHATWDAALKERELVVFRRRLEGLNPHKRPTVQPQDRTEILLIMRLRGWSLKKTSRRFVLHKNTIWGWRKEFLGGEEIGCFFGPAPFNRLGDAVRWLIHEMRALCPDMATGTRTIANMIVQAGIKVSRSSVQRILREEKPKRRRASAADVIMIDGEPVRPYHILRPRRINRTWHLDLTVLSVLGRRFHIAALLDGFSRKLLALKVYARTPTWVMMRSLVGRAARTHGVPRFLVTDHGCQFRYRFKRSVKRLGIAVVKGPVRSFRFNGKAERFFRTLKLWMRPTLFAWFPDKVRVARRMQRQLDCFRDWYNARRPHQSLGARTPDQEWTGDGIPTAIAIRAREPQPIIHVARRGHDLRLPDLDIRIEWHEAA